MKYTDFAIEKLGTPTIASPVKNLDFVRDDANVAYHNDIRDITANPDEPILAFEQAGPRDMIYHDPSWSRAAILTAGGKGNVRLESMHMGAFFRMLNARGYEDHFALSTKTDTFPAHQDETAKEQVRSIARWLNSPELPPEFRNSNICACRK